ncbi:syndecan-1 [Lates calcarifer]|uniref:Syndecan-1 n=1 Tax=Lates calcarifer TaxID=8187 RepID=A0AAJ7Q9L4_LATCA|nr:syndecan-1 [Lates calcarifer]
MRLSLTASLFFTLGLIHPINMSFSAHPEDSEGYDLDGSGSGSGDGSDQVSPSENTNVLDQPNNKGRAFDDKNWPEIDTGSGFIFMANSKSPLENKRIVAGIIAGGVTGAALAAVLIGLLIYKWHIKDDRGYILAQQTHTEEVV